MVVAKKEEKKGAPEAAAPAEGAPKKEEAKAAPKKEEAKKALVQAQSVPACNSHTHPACKDAKTAAPEHLGPLWTQAQVQLTARSDPICNSSGCT